MLLEVKHVKKVFGKGLNRTEALSDMNLLLIPVKVCSHYG